jgi:hypothetical protein
LHLVAVHESACGKDIAAVVINVCFGGKADIAAKLLIKDEARRIAANVAMSSDQTWGVC